jgi:hypothetical protein
VFLSGRDYYFKITRFHPNLFSFLVRLVLQETRLASRELVTPAISNVTLIVGCLVLIVKLRYYLGMKNYLFLVSVLLALFFVLPIVTNAATNNCLKEGEEKSLMPLPTGGQDNRVCCADLVFKSTLPICPGCLAEADVDTCVKNPLASNWSSFRANILRQILTLQKQLLVLLRLQKAETSASVATSTATSNVATCKGRDEAKCHPGTTTQGMWINQDNPANWPTYNNEKLGFSIKYPGTAYFGNGAPCRYIAGEDNSYRPVGSSIPTKIFEDGENVYITNEYFYRLSGEKILGGIHKYSACGKEQNSLTELQKASSIYSQGWEIKTKKVYADVDLEKFIKDNYGPSCKLGSKTPAIQNGVFSVKIEGDGLDLDETKCPVNYVYRILYFPAGNLVAAWNLGQACSFTPSESYSKCLDGEISASFKFLTK